VLELVLSWPPLPVEPALVLAIVVEAAWLLLPAPPTFPCGALPPCPEPTESPSLHPIARRIASETIVNRGTEGQLEEGEGDIEVPPSKVSGRDESSTIT
jgi:hypothetical protein